MAGRLFVVDADNHAGDIAFASFPLLATAYLFIAMRFWRREVKREVIKRMHWDDAVLLAATAAATIATLCAYSAAQHGVGDAPNMITGYDSTVSAILIAFTYTFYIVSVTLNKLAYLGIARHILKRSGTLLKSGAVVSVAAIVLLWGSLAIGAKFQQCPPSYGIHRCFADGNLYLPVACCDIVLECLCIIIPLSTILHSMMPRLKKTEYCFIFGLRISIIGTVVWRITRMATLVQRNVPPRAWARNTSQATITMLLEMTLGIVVTCLPFIQPLVLGPDADKDDQQDSVSNVNSPEPRPSSAQSPSDPRNSKIVSPPQARELEEYHMELEEYHMTQALPLAHPSQARWSASDREHARNSTQFYASGPGIGIGL